MTEANKTRAIEWAEYVLPIWEKYYPNDNRPRRAVEAAKTKDVSDAAALAALSAYAACAAYRADAANAVSYAASYAASAHAAYVASQAAQAILLERYGEDIVKVRKVLLLKKFINFESIKWIDYKPEQFWDVMLETYCENK